jgi:CRISPR-associated protein Csm2
MARRKKLGLPSNYLSKGYFDERGNLHEELIVAHAKQIAYALAQSRMTATSLRRFFGKVRFIERRLERRNDFHAIVPEILALVPYVNNAETRRVIPAIFREFIERNVELAKKDQKAFCDGFLKHFEYIVAFFPREK